MPMLSACTLFVFETAQQSLHSLNGNPSGAFVVFLMSVESRDNETTFWVRSFFKSPVLVSEDVHFSAQILEKEFMVHDLLFCVEARRREKNNCEVVLRVALLSWAAFVVHACSHFYCTFFLDASISCVQQVFFTLRFSDLRFFVLRFKSSDFISVAHFCTYLHSCECIYVCLLRMPLRFICCIFYSVYAWLHFVTTYHDIFVTLKSGNI